LGVVDAGTIENDTGYLSGLVKDVAKVHDIPPEVFLGKRKVLSTCLTRRERDVNPSDTEEASSGVAAEPGNLRKVEGD
jgi:hypothetical protein